MGTCLHCEKPCDHSCLEGEVLIPEFVDVDRLWIVEMQEIWPLENLYYVV